MTDLAIIMNAPTRSTAVPRRAKAAVASPGAVRIAQTALREDCTAVELAQLAQLDPAFALRLLAVVNSAAFNVKSPVRDIVQAASLLGVRGLRNVALSLLLADLVPASSTGELLLAGALRRGLAARALAPTVGERDGELAFTCGLFADVGLLTLATEDELLAAEVAQLPSRHRVVRERASNRESHVLTGVALAEQYRLPADIVGAIATHHDAEPPKAPLGRLVWLAERAANVLEGPSTNTLLQEACAAAELVGVPGVELDRIVRALPAQVEQAARAFEREVGAQLTLEELGRDASERLVALNAEYEQLVRALERLLAEKDQLAEELRLANEALSSQAMTDTLTHLPNRRAFDQALARDLATALREKLPLTLVMLDVDHFKLFNDTWGHATGDQVLRQLGELLPTCLRGGDLAARFGGEEFVVLLPRTAGHDALVVAERIRNAVARMKIQGPDGLLRVTTSLGVAATDDPGAVPSQQDLFERADAALYAAKRAGRNRVQRAASGPPVHTAPPATVRR